VADACRYPGYVDYRAELYSGGLDDYVAVLHLLPEAVDHVLVVGHNPPAEELASALSGMPKRLPRAAVAHLRLSIDTWPELSLFLPGGLANLWRPRELVAEEVVS
jgi:phosphohistidine phosphatase